MRTLYCVVGVFLMLIGMPIASWTQNATGFTITDPCGSGPFGKGVTDMQLHLTRFPTQTGKREIIFKMPSMLGPAGMKDWVVTPAESCTRSGVCVSALSAKVQVLDYNSTGRIKGKFEVVLSDGNAMNGSFVAKPRKATNQAICE